MTRAITILMLSCLCAFGAADNSPRVIRLAGFRGLAIAPQSFDFSPTNIPTLFGWWRPEGLTNLVNGTPIAFWQDDSGHSLPMTPGDGDTNHTPTFAASFQNGKAAVRFDGVTQFLTNLCTVGQTNVFFMVLRQDFPLTAFGFIIDAQDDGSNIEESFYFRAGGDNSYSYTQAAASSSFGGADGSPGPTTNQVATYIVQFSGASSKIYTNGVLWSSGDVGTGNLYSGMRVGRSGPGRNYYFKGNILEMGCITNTFITQSTYLTDLSAYLRGKYAHY